MYDPVRLNCKVPRNEIERYILKETVSKRHKFSYCNSTDCFLLIYDTSWSDIPPFVTLDAQNKRPTV